jgi:putative intracellular protease/amidase
MPTRILLPVPDRDFDATEVSVPWRLLTRAGLEVVFATEHGGSAPACDPKTLSGAMMGMFGASGEVKWFYSELQEAPEFQKPIAWNDIDPKSFGALVLPGGHAPGMKQYLGSEVLQQKVAAFWALERPVAAICHGVLVLARAKDAKTGKSVLFRSTTTCLPKYMERMAYLSTAMVLGRYYRTYDAYVEEEVRGALEDPEKQFVRGPRVLNFSHVVTAHESSALCVEDGRYVSARWPGDAYLWTQKLLDRLGAAAKAA